MGINVKIRRNEAERIYGITSFIDHNSKNSLERFSIGAKKASANVFNDRWKIT